MEWSILALWMARIIEGPSEPKANISLTHLYHLQWNKLSHQHLYLNKGFCHYMLLLLHVDYDWSCRGDNPYYPFSRPIGVVLLWSKVSENHHIQITFLKMHGIFPKYHIMLT
jgi:hypothetical protein